jgi:hypothetical protein
VIQGAPRRFSPVQYAGIALSPRAWESCWIAAKRSKALAVVRAGPRSGRLAWEVKELYVRRGAISESATVLEELSFHAGQAGARRLFVRLVPGSPAFFEARQAGFMPCLTETLFRAPSAADCLRALGGEATEDDLRPRQPDDTEPLFRLYCATAPVETRFGCGQTLQEWASAIERPGKKPQEFVVDDGSGHLKAQLAVTEVSGGRYFSLTWSRDCKAGPAALLARCLAGSAAGPALTLVPAHNTGLRQILEETGFEAVADYETLARPLAVPVMEPRRAVAAIG